MRTTKEIFLNKIGEFDCWAVNDGYHEYSLDTFFANVDMDELVPALRSGGWPLDSYLSPYTSLYIRTGEHHILVDTGTGGLYPNTGNLSANLKAMRIRPEMIDMLVITHAHPDHIRGILKEDGTPTYPNARIYTTKQEWEFWLAEDAPQKAPGFKDTIKLVHRVYEVLGDRFHYLQPEEELVHGVRLLEAFGHTPGHVAVQVSSPGESVIHLSDTVFHPLHMLNPGWLPQGKYIFDTAQYQETARRLVRRAVEMNALVLGTHFPPFPGMGYFIEGESGLEWQPVSGP